MVIGMVDLELQAMVQQADRPQTIHITARDHLHLQGLPMALNQQLKLTGVCLISAAVLHVLTGIRLHGFCGIRIE